MCRVNSFQRCLLYIATATLLSPGCASLKVYHGFQKDRTGVVYRLPRAVLLVNVPITKTTHGPTSLTPYAPISIGPFQGLPPIELPDEWTDKSSDFNQFGYASPSLGRAVEPDPEQVYFVELRGSASQNRNLKLSLNQLGVMIDGESHVQDKKLELAFATIEAGLRIGVSAMGIPGPGFRAIESEDQAQIEAVELRRELQAVRAKRRTWLFDHPKAGVGDFHNALAELDQRAAQIVSRFVRTSQKTIAAIFEIRPTPNGNCMDGELKELITLDTNRGVTWIAGATQGEIIGPKQIPADFRLSTVAAGQSSTIKIAMTRNAAYHVSDSTSTIDEPSGFVYRIPGAVDVRLGEYDSSDLVRDLVSQTVQLPQVGIVAALPRHAGLSPDQLVSVALYEDTGAIKAMQAESKSLDPALIRGFGTNVAESLDKLAAARKAAADTAAARPSKFARMTARLKEFAELTSALQAAGLPVPPLPDPMTLAVPE